MGTLYFFAALLLVVAIHEYGHLLAARAFRIPVNSFSIGMGPVLLRKNDRHGTEWKFSLLPIGGYITMDPEAHQVQHPLKRSLIALAGPAANILVVVTVILAIAGPSAVAELFNALWQAYGETIRACWEALTFQKQDSLVGPVGAIDMANDKTSPVGDFFTLFLVLNLGIAVFNLLPIPPLDGGHIMLNLIETVFGKEASERAGLILIPVGALLLLALIVIIMFNDIVRLFQ